MIRLFSNADYDFISHRKQAFGITFVLLAIGLISLLTRGVHQSIEFTGGTLVQFTTTAPIEVEKLRAGLDAAGIKGAEIQRFGAENEYVVRARTAAEGTDADDTQATASRVNAAIAAVAGEGNFTPGSGEAVSPKVGGELKSQALYAILLSFLAVLAYLAYRFEWRFGLAAVIATAHDILLTVCFIAIMRIELSLVVVAAVLSMVGYSLNDTIIIFDRVRENLHKYRRSELVPVLNRSINETLPRSVLTHATTLVTLLALAIFAGDVIRPFALVMFFGVFTGTFSSIWIAAPVLMLIEQRWPGVDGRGVKVKGGIVQPRDHAPV
ncbi:MAG: protein translocase subunit SecF [Gemmatimonadales bacterium]|nr:protein translocase subunit SecF [Gemmatimonadales bacterium]